MASWIYKCNSRDHPYQVAVGDWDEFFAGPGDGAWGSTKWVPDLARAQSGDIVLAYQTDRNELVGVTKVVALRRRGSHQELILRPIEELRVKVRPLKKQSTAISRIPALQPGPIRTLYAVSESDLKRLLRAAKAQYRVDLKSAASEADNSRVGAGFGSPEENRKVEKAAIRHVRDHLCRCKWEVRDVSSLHRGYDLECRRNRALLHVEVKGVRGSAQKFILTRGEFSTWQRDEHFRLALVTNALTKPTLFQFRGPTSLQDVSMQPVAYVCVIRPSP